MRDDALFRWPPGGIEWREFLGEAYGDVIDLIVNSLKRSDDGKTFYGRAPLPKDYLRLQAEAHVHAFEPAPAVRNFAGNIQCPDICAVYQLHPQFCAHVINPERRRASTHDQTHPPCDSGGDLDESMFVGVVYFVQKPKRVQSTRRNRAKERMGAPSPLPIPSLVRLKALKDCPVWSADISKPALAVGPSLTFRSGAARPVTIDREAGRLKQGIAGRIARQRELAGQVVEAGSKVVRDLPDINRPSQGRVSLAGGSCAERIFAGVRVMLGYDNSISVSFQKAVDFPFQGVDLSLCSIKLSDRSPKRMHTVQNRIQSGGDVNAGGAVSQ